MIIPLSAMYLLVNTNGTYRDIYQQVVVCKEMCCYIFMACLFQENVSKQLFLEHLSAGGREMQYRYL